MVLDIARNSLSRLWGALMLSLAVAAVMFRDGLWHMVQSWQRPEYSYGYLIPPLTLYLLWQYRAELRSIPKPGSWLGVGIVIAGLSLFMLGELSTLFIIIEYAFLVVVYGLAYTVLGWRGFRIVALPLLILAFMIPLPSFIYNNLSAQLQLLSSQLGVAFIRLFDISVYLAGNVIDLGTYRLEVAEACNGLRYLFPLMTIGFIVAYFFQAPFWQRALVFISTIPITVLMNSFRIGVIGVMVEYWGPRMADGFLHDFEGWAVFMMSFGILFVEMIVLYRLTGGKKPFRDIFGIPQSATPISENVVRDEGCPRALIGATVIVLAWFGATVTLPERVEVIPDRPAFYEFPTTHGEWTGTRERLEDVYLTALKLTDYLLINYVDKERVPLNFYVAYYDSQRKGESAHSPRSCLPGDGWEIESLTQRTIDGVTVGDRPLRANRVLIRKGDSRQLVYYWFQQRGRAITNEYLVKWFIFWDALTRNRTDGALVRVVVPVASFQEVAAQDAMVASFIEDFAMDIRRHIPD